MVVVDVDAVRCQREQKRHWSSAGESLFRRSVCIEYALLYTGLGGYYLCLVLSRLLFSLSLSKSLSVSGFCGWVWLYISDGLTSGGCVVCLVPGLYG